jgi:hypothetical protein
MPPIRITAQIRAIARILLRYLGSLGEPDLRSGDLGSSPLLAASPPSEKRSNTLRPAVGNGANSSPCGLRLAAEQMLLPITPPP